MSENTVALPGRERKVDGGKINGGWKCPVFKASGIFSSHMVLQRDEPILVWGFSDAPGSVVKGSFMGYEAEARVDDDNGWRLCFPAQAWTKEPQTMTLTDDRGNGQVFRDVLVGDVWVIGGQSNAELTLSPCVTATEKEIFDENDNFRLFIQTQKYVGEHLDLCAAPQRDVICPEWAWSRPDEDHSLRFSAMGWYFAREMSRNIEIPLGMVMAAAGGACLRELAPEDLVHAQGVFYGANVPVAGYFNTLIYPLIPLRFKAMLFFQGESEGLDRGLSESYAEDLALLIYDERQRFGFDFPVYNVQLSNYPEPGPTFFPYHDIVRVEQVEALKRIRKCTLTPDYDLGSPKGYEDWPHSPLKKELAHRLAMLALCREYGTGTEEDVGAPICAGAELTADGKAIAVRFTGVSGGLAGGKDGTVHGFAVGPYDRRVPAQAHITAPDTVTVTVPEGADASCVSYAFFLTITPENADLRGGSGIPALAFNKTVKKK